MGVLAVVPAFRSEELVGETVESLLRMAGVSRVVVVDDASEDRTATEAFKAGASVVVNGRNLGKGGSLNRVLRELEFEILLLIDSDLGRHASQAYLVLEPVIDRSADLAIAAFPPADKGGFGLVQGLARRGIERLAGARMCSPLSGQRAMTREAFEKVYPFDRSFGVEVAMTVDALKAGLRVIEVETTMSHRETGRDLHGFIHRGRQFVDVSRSLLKRALGVRR